jgi:Rv0078B-related antitoxin
MSEADRVAAARLRTTFDLFAAGVRMMRQNLRRRHPDASEEEIESRLRAWMSHRPGAEHGDGVGRPTAWPREASRAT